MTGKGKERAMTKDTKKAGIKPPRIFAYILHIINLSNVAVLNSNLVPQDLVSRLRFDKSCTHNFYSYYR